MQISGQKENVSADLPDLSAFLSSTVLKLNTDWDVFIAHLHI